MIFEFYKMIITRTPFRISFFGGGSDYPIWFENNNGGKVVATSINKYCYISCRNLPPFFDYHTRVVWSHIELIQDIDEIKHPVVREAMKWLNIPRGLSVHHEADLPARSGLGSSSAFTVGLLNALYALKGKMVDKRQLALDAIALEQERLKENVGCQDQTIAAFGGLNKIEFGGDHKINVQPIPLTQSRLEELQDHLMLFFTGFSRTASEVAAEQIRSTPSKTEEIKTMTKLVDGAIDILVNGNNLDDFGRLLHETWQIKRGLTSKISNSAIDEIYETGRKAGAIGGKLLGAGGGGFMLFFVKPEYQPQVKQALKDLLHVPFRFENLGSQIIYYGPVNHH